MLSINLDSRFFQDVYNQSKTVEARLNRGKFKEFRIGDKINIKEAGNDDNFHVIIVDIDCYQNFKQMLEFEGLKRVLPGIESIDDGIKVYRQFYSEEDESRYGVVAFTLEVLP